MRKLWRYLFGGPKESPVWLVDRYGAVILPKRRMVLKAQA
jgi:hypothetical protein